ncbi:MAG: RNA polymerase sigma-70 factor, partial [Bacteroidetes bacterium]|nr:RNA polymerase sigma-70 factor [Bacteroidota bacterium]
MKNHSTYEEKSLLGLVARGDESAFHTLYTHHRNHVYGIALRLLQSASLAEDVLQEVFLKIWIGREKLPEINCFRAYLNTITRNHIYNTLRKQAYEELLLERLLPLQMASLRGTALDDISYRELREDLQRVIETLTPQQKRVFELSRMEGLKHEDIARQLNVSRETVKKHVSEALRMVRLRLRQLKHFP